MKKKSIKQLCESNTNPQSCFKYTTSYTHSHNDYFPISHHHFPPHQSQKTLLCKQKKRHRSVTFILPICQNRHISSSLGQFYFIDVSEPSYVIIVKCLSYNHIQKSKFCQPISNTFIINQLFTLRLFLPWMISNFLHFTLRNQGTFINNVYTMLLTQPIHYDIIHIQKHECFCKLKQGELI